MVELHLNTTNKLLKKCLHLMFFFIKEPVRNGHPFQMMESDDEAYTPK